MTSLHYCLAILTKTESLAYLKHLLVFVLLDDRVDSHGHPSQVLTLLTLDKGSFCGQAFHTVSVTYDVLLHSHSASETGFASPLILILALILWVQLVI